MTIASSENPHLSVAELINTVASGLEGSNASPATIRRTMRPFLELFASAGVGSYNDYADMISEVYTPNVYRICQSRYDG